MSSIKMKKQIIIVNLPLNTLMLPNSVFFFFKSFRRILHMSFFSLLLSNRQKRLTHSFQGSEAPLMSSWQTEQSSKHSRDGVRQRMHHSQLTEVQGDVRVWWNHYAGTSSSLWCQHSSGMTEHCVAISPPLVKMGWNLEIHDVNTLLVILSITHSEFSPSICFTLTFQFKQGGEHHGNPDFCPFANIKLW